MPSQHVRYECVPLHFIFLNLQIEKSTSFGKYTGIYKLIRRMSSQTHANFGLNLIYCRLLDPKKCTGSRLLSPKWAMPSKLAAAAKPSCNVENINREWKDAPAVRLVAVRRDRLFESSKVRSDLEENQPLKLCIKDAVHNKYVLIPMLRRMAMMKNHTLPSVKAIAREILCL